MAVKYTISIHAPREGRDVGQGGILSPSLYFNPRAPRGARPVRVNSFSSLMRFQSTRPARGATIAAVSICADIIGFQSTRPARGATIYTVDLALDISISIHAPREGRDSKSEQISLHIFAKKAWIPDIFAQNAAFQSVLPLADRQKLLYLRCEPLRKFLRAFASHYKIIGSSGR